MKRIYILFTIFILIIILFLTKLYYDSFKHNIAFNQLDPNTNTLTKVLVKNYFSNESYDRDAIIKSIKKIVLHNTNYENWIEYIDFIEIMIFPLDTQSDEIEDLIIAVNLSKDQGILAIYKSHEDNYILKHTIENLTNINSISVIENSNSQRAFILIEQFLDERIGAYFTDSYLQIFTMIEHDYREVYRQSIDYNAYYFEKWINPSSEDSRWFKIIETSVIDNISNYDNNIYLQIYKTSSLYESNQGDISNIPDSFSLVEEKSFDLKYAWSDKYNYFIQGEGKIISSNKTVGIIDVNNQYSDYLLYLEDKYYKVIDEKGKSFYVDEADFNITHLFINSE